MSKKRLLIPVILVLVISSFAPSMAGWGAGWGSGSVNGFSTGTVPYSNGTSVKAVVAPPACKGHGDGDHDHDDRDDCTREMKPGSAPVQTNVVSTTSSDPTVLTGAVFCKRANKSDDDDDHNQVRRGVNLATVKINVPGSTTVQNGQFSIHISVPQAILDTLDAKSLCAKSGDYEKDSKGKDMGSWKIIDFVPREFFARLKVGPETRTFSCVMQPADFNALGWDKHAGHPSNKPYQC